MRLPRAVCFHKSSSPRSIHPSPFQTNERQSWGPDGHERHCVGTCLTCTGHCPVFAFSWCRAASIFTVLWRRVSVCRPPRASSPSSQRHESDCDSCLRLGYLACAAWQQPSFPQDPRAAAADTDEAGLFFFFAWFPFVASPHLPVRLRVWASTVPVHIHQHATKEQLHCHGVSWRELGRRFISGVRLHALAGTHLATMNSTGPGAGSSSASRAGLAAAACVPSAPALPGSSIGVSPLVPD